MSAEQSTQGMDGAEGARSHVRNLAEVADWSVAAIWVVVALATVATAAAISYVGAVSAPILDGWAFVDPSQYLANPLERWNGHPILTNRLMLALDYWAFDGTGDFVRFAIFLLKAGQAAAFVMLARLAGLRTRAEVTTFAAAAALTAFNPAPDIDLRQSFQFCFVLVFAASAGAIAALAHYAAQRRRRFIALAAALALIATQSLLSGLLTPVLLILMALRMRLPRWTLAVFAAVLAFAIAVIVLNPGGAMSSPAPVSFGMLSFALQILGSAPALIVQSAQQMLSLPVAAPEQTATWLGTLMLLAAAPIGWRVVQRRKVEPALVATAAIVAFAVGSALMIALGRFATGNALTPRFAEVSTLALGALTTAGALALKDARPALRRLVLAASVMLALPAPIAGAHLVQTNSNLGRERTLAVAAQVSQIQDWRSARRLGGRMAIYFPAAIAELRANGKMHFADRWTRALGQPVVDLPARRCAGEIALGPARFRGFMAFEGRVSGADAAHGQTILILNEQGIMVGYGRTPRSWQELAGGLLGPQHKEAIGYAARVRDFSSYSAYLATERGVFCRLEVQRSGRI